jgi:hypothetical protein
MMQCRTLFLSCIVLFVLISFPLINSVGASSMIWSKTFGGDDTDACTSMVQTADGGFALFGFAHSFGTGAWLVKTDEYGNMEWNKTIGGAASLVQTSDGGFALAGYTITSNDHLLADFLLIKTDNRGNMLWNQTYPGGAVLGYPSLIQTVDGGFALSGGIGSFETRDYDFWLIKTDAHAIPQSPSWIVATIVIVTIAVVGVALFVYFVKVKKTNGEERRTRQLFTHEPSRYFRNPTVSNLVVVADIFNH